MHLGAHCNTYISRKDVYCPEYNLNPGERAKVDEVQARSNCGPNNARGNYWPQGRVASHLNGANRKQSGILVESEEKANGVIQVPVCDGTKQ